VTRPNLLIAIYTASIMTMATARVAFSFPDEV
jgi:hypothetical protein